MEKDYLGDGVYAEFLGGAIWLTTLTGHRISLDRPTYEAVKRYAARCGMEPAGAPPPEEHPCPRCQGCGQVANSEQEEPWSEWESLPPGSDAAVRMGIVRPKPCPECDGAGVSSPLTLAAPAREGERG